MSIAISTRVWEHGPDEDSLLLTLLALADRMDDQGVTLPRFGGVQEIAKRIRKTRRQAIRNLRKLESEGWITVDRRAVLRPGLQGAQNRYRICLEKLGVIGDITMSHPHPVPDDITMSPITGRSGDTAMSSENQVSGDISSTDQVTSGVISGDISASHNNRKNVERNYNVAALAAELASKERSLQGERISSALLRELESEIKTGAEPVEAGNRILAQVRRYISAQRNGHFAIHGWSDANFLSGGHWRDEQSWPWKPEHRPERKMRYVDPANLYTRPGISATRGGCMRHLAPRSSRLVTMRRKLRPSPR